jgi:hypothetical protein
LGDLSKLPRWLGHIYDLDTLEQKTALIGVLQSEGRLKRVPMMGSAPPSDFIQWPDAFNAMKSRPLDVTGDSVAAITSPRRRQDQSWVPVPRGCLPTCETPA